MNRIEKFVYDIVKENPSLKNKIRNLYQSFFDLLPRGNDYSINPIIDVEDCFFGFHDLSPFSKNGDYILSNKLIIPLKMPTFGDELIVGYWNKDLSAYTEVGRSTAWNYHKGCRLQWCGSDSNKLIYNNYKDNHLCAIYKDILTGLYKCIDYPIDTVSPNGCIATSFSYERLNKYMPGYGYLYTDQAFLDESHSKNTGLFLVDIMDNSQKLIVSLKDLYDINHEKSMDGAHHYITHTQFSPKGDKIAFLHRWTFDDPEKRWTRLVTCNLDGSELFTSCTTGMVSHFDWDEKHGILAYCQINGIDGHYVFPDYKLKKAIRVATSINSDGHQSYIPNSNFFITDTYPDKRRFAKLYLSNINDGQTILIASLYSHKKYQSPSYDKHWACDLHPRVSPDGKYVCFDSVHTGKRELCVMEISNLLTYDDKK